MIQEVATDNNKARKRANCIVAIGASAGGLAALIELFKELPRVIGIGFVIIQHLSPNYNSRLDEILSGYTELKIRKATTNMLVEADNIYLITPRTNLFIVQGRLVVVNQEINTGLRHPIDIFFQSMAADIGRSAIGIILSGAGSDGSLGICAIKKAGGLVIVQEESTALFNFMPRSAIETGLVDHILRPGKMAIELVKYNNSIQVI